MKPNLIYIAPHNSSFIEQDTKLLSVDNNVTFLTDKWHNKVLLLKCFVKQFLLLIYHLNNTDKVICSFGGYSSFLPSLLSKLYGVPCFIIINGTDAVALDAQNYGLLRKKTPKWFVKKSYQWCTKLLPVSESLIYSSSNYLNKSKPLIVGVKHYLQKINFEYQVIPNGFDTNYWTYSSIIEKESDSFIAVMNKSQFILKGGDLIYDIAKLNPNDQYYIAGMAQPKHFTPLKNLKFLGILSKSELKNRYQRTKFILQLSIFEGFGCSLCEGILCGCYPIVSNVNELPTIINSYGKILKTRDLDLLNSLINHCKSLSNKELEIDLSVKRMKSIYDIKKRIKSLNDC